jgi:surface antigen
MTQDATINTLVAYVDGELDDAAARRVEVLLADSPELRAVVRDLREGTSLLRAAFNEVLRAPVPPTLGQAIEAGFARRIEAAVGPKPVAAGRPPWRRGFAYAIAASVALLIVAGVGATITSRMMVDREIARLERAGQEDRRLLAQVINEALEQRLSGVAVDWRNPGSGTHGTVTPVRTFRNVGGQWCREYSRLTISGDRRELRRAIACREPDGTWQTRLESLTEG